MVNKWDPQKLPKDVVCEVCEWTTRSWPLSLPSFLLSHLGSSASLGAPRPMLSSCRPGTPGKLRHASARWYQWDITHISPQNWERHQNYSKLPIEAAKMRISSYFHHILSIFNIDFFAPKSTESGKSLGTMSYWDEVFLGPSKNYPLVNVYIAMENHHFSWENPLFLWPFSIGMLVYQRVSSHP